VTDAVLDVPYYEQTSEFTCGPACILMTTAALTRDPFELARVHEFKVWRRCCLIGIGGTDAFGFSLPLLDRGLDVKIYNERVPTLPEDLLLSFLTEEDATLARWSSKQAREETLAEGADLVEKAPTVDDVEAAWTRCTARRFRTGWSRSASTRTACGSTTPTRRAARPRSS
jgi:hypothetical protein